MKQGFLDTLQSVAEKGKKSPLSRLAVDGSAMLNRPPTGGEAAAFVDVALGRGEALEVLEHAGRQTGLIAKERPDRDSVRQKARDRAVGGFCNDVLAGRPPKGKGVKVDLVNAIRRDRNHVAKLAAYAASIEEGESADPVVLYAWVRASELVDMAKFRGLLESAADKAEQASTKRYMQPLKDSYCAIQLQESANTEIDIPSDVEVEERDVEVEAARARFELGKFETPTTEQTTEASLPN